MYVRTIPSPEPESPTDTRIKAYDPIIGHIIGEAVAWAKVGFPCTGSFDAVWNLAVERERRAEDNRCYMAVRAALPELPIMVHAHGDSPGMPGYLEIIFDREGDEDFRTICFGTAMEPYRNASGDMVMYQAWYNDQNGNLDIIEVVTPTVDRVAAIVQYLFDKWNVQYINDGTKER